VAIPTPGPRRPTDAELAILRILWERGPSTVRQVLASLNEERDTGYTTALKLLQIMADKGLVERDDRVRPQVYQPRLSRDQTERQLVRDLLDRAFSGSARRLVLHALAEKKVSTKERAEIDRILARLEEEGQ
jgi:BlaI family transcriptional regulator, penicillinase repressor